MGKKRPYCLTIAGFDPSGGAGIIADCKVFEQLKVHGLSVITANTVQTEDAYLETHWTDFSLILKQLTVLLERYPVTHFKIGLIENELVLNAVLDLIHSKVEHPFIVWDPILHPTAGGELSGKRFSGLLNELLSKTSLITPNIPEFKALFGEQEAAEAVQTHGVMIYLKGGHAREKGKDFLYTTEQCHPFNSQVNTSLSKHGTGCILSAALTAYLSRSFPLVKTCLRSKRYLEKTLISSPTLLAYHHS